MDPTTGADAWIDVARRTHDHLADVVRALDADALARPSAAAEWNVAQVLGHLGSSSEIGLATLEDALAGGTGLPQDFNQPVWDRWDALDDQGKAEGFLHQSEAVLTCLEALDPGTRRDLRIPLPYFPEPVGLAFYVRLRVSELTYHGWDVRATVEDSPTLFQPAVEILLDHTGQFIGYFGKADAVDGRPLDIAVETTDPSRTFTLTLADAVSLTAGAPGDPAATLRLPAEAWMRLTYGRLPPEHTPAGVTLTGDGVSLDDLRRVFPGV